MQKNNALTETINKPNLDKVKKAWLHDILVLCDLLKAKRPNDYEFMYNAEGFSYYPKLKKYCKDLRNYILAHDCKNCELIDSILQYLATIRFVGDISKGKLGLNDWKTLVYNHRDPNLQFSPEIEAETLAEFFAKNNMTWNCNEKDYDNINSTFFKALKNYNCIKVV